MPQFLDRWLEWFRTRSTRDKAAILVAAVLVAVFACSVLRWVTMLVLIAVVIALIAGAAQRTPVRHLVIAAVALLAAFFVFGALASAVYGPSGEAASKRSRRRRPPRSRRSRPLRLLRKRSPHPNRRPSRSRRPYLASIR